MRGKRRQVVAVLIVLALLAAACTGSEPEPTSAPEGTQSAEGAKEMMDEALGGTQAVQDFLLYLDMSVQTDDGPVSYYDEVLAEAESGTGALLELAGGFTLAVVESLDGEIRDASGEVLPTLSLDFALLSPGPEALAEGRAHIAEQFEASGNSEIMDEVFGATVGTPTVLIEIVTADFSQRRTHLGAGDLGAVDLTFVSSIAPGDRMASSYVFGQTLPGDPEVEAGLSAHELFAYRWNLGLISMLGDGEGFTAVVDGTVTAVEGSTIRLTREKEALIEAARNRAGLDEMIRIIDEVRDVVAEHEGLGAAPIEIGGVPLWVNKDGDLGMRLPIWEYPPDSVGAPVDAGKLILAAAINEQVLACAIETFNQLYLNDPVRRIPSDWFPFVEDHCAPPDLSQIWGGGTFTDVHLRTFDGWDYDNQAAGEFLVFDNGVAEVQLRTEPWPDSDAVSIATAVAVGIGDHKVSMQHGGELWIDDVSTDLNRGETIAVGDAAVLWTGTGWVVVWPDGTRVSVSNAVRNTLLFVYPSALPSVGMLGSADGDGSNDWVTRSGDQLDSEIRFDFEAFYPTFIDTWRISHGESLFHYKPGESTDTFSIEGFPRIKYDLDDLDPTERADAEQACRNGGVERADMVRDCVLDVVLTGDESFIYDTYVAQSSLSALPSLGEAERGANSVTVGPLAVDFGPEPAVVIPDTLVEWVCQVSEGSFDAFSEFQESAGRLIGVSIVYRDASSSGTGEEKATIVVLLNRRAYAWAQVGVDPSAGSLDDLSLNGRTLTAKGTAFLNDPLDTDLNQAFPLPEGAILKPLTLQVSCDS